MIPARIKEVEAVAATAMVITRVCDMADKIGFCCSCVVFVHGNFFGNFRAMIMELS